MLEVPQVYTARYFETDSDGVKWEYRWVAAGPVGRCHLDHAFTDGDRQSEKIYIPIFNGSLNTEGTKLDLIEASKKDNEGELSMDDFKYSGGNAENIAEFLEMLPSLKGSKS